MHQLFRFGAVFTTELCSVGLSDITAANAKAVVGIEAGIMSDGVNVQCYCWSNRLLVKNQTMAEIEAISPAEISLGHIPVLQNRYLKALLHP